MPLLAILLEPLRRQRKSVPGKTVQSAPTLSGANLTNTILDGVDLRGVDLSQTIGLTTDQLKSAVVDCNTRLPANVTAQVRSA